MTRKATPSEVQTPTDPGALALSAGSRLGSFEVLRVITRSAGTVVYLVTDHALGMPVALEEYLPVRFVRRDGAQCLQALDSAHDPVIARGRQAFIEETRMLARCDHRALVRVSQLFEANGTSYRVMPYHPGQRLYDVRRGMGAAPDEAALRGLLDDLLGALAAIHDSGHVHGSVAPANILLLADDRPLLLGTHAADREVGDAPADPLATGPHPSSGPFTADATPATDPRVDLHALAEVIRFCIMGTLPTVDSPPQTQDLLAPAIARAFEPALRPRYSAIFVSAIDAASSPFVQDWPLNAAQFRDWLAVGAPRRSRFIDLSPVPAASDGGTTPPAIRAPAARQAATPAPGRAGGLSRSGRRWWWLGGTLSLLVVGAVIGMRPWGLVPTPPAERPAQAVTGGAVVDLNGITESPPAAGPIPREAPVAGPAVTPEAAAPIPPPPAPPPRPQPRVDRPTPRAAPIIITPEGATDPRSACAPRTEFALYRCMQIQCSSPQWAAHAQCVRLKERDSIE